MPDDRRRSSVKRAAAGPRRPVVDADRRRGRGARSNRAGRFESELREAFDDGWESLGRAGALQDRRAPGDGQEHHLHATTAPTSASTSPSTPIAAASTAASTASRGRRTAYLGHSAGLDFETKLYAKVNAAELLEQELANPRYVPKYIALGAVTDPYQPIEREHRITRSMLEVLDRASHPGRHRHQVGPGGARRRHPRAHGGAAASPRWPSP